MAMPTRPGNTERGWNDPPEFLHTGTSSSATAIPPRRTPLTKRVFHSEVAPGESSSPPSAVSALSGSPPLMGTTPPLSGFMLPPAASDHSHSTNLRKDVTTSMDAQKPPKSNIVLYPPTATTAVSNFPAPIIVPNMEQAGTSPPMDMIPDILTPPGSPGSPTVLIPAGSPPSSNSLREPSKLPAEVEIPHFNDDQQLFHYVLSRLQKVLNHCQPNVGARVIDDINKKLKIFESMWQEGKISYHVKSSMARLAIALNERKCDLAHEIHLNLMMDYVSEVGQWMVGIKRLIQEARNLESPLSPADAASGNENAQSQLPISEPNNEALDKPTDDLKGASLEPQESEIDTSSKEVSEEQPKDCTGDHKNILLSPESSDVPQESSGVPQESSGVPQESSGVPQESSDVPQESSDVPQESSDVPQESSDVPPDNKDTNVPDS